MTTPSTITAAHLERLISPERFTTSRQAQPDPDVAVALSTSTCLGRVWTWARKYRTRETNIGLSPAGIGVAVRSLVDDTLAWIESATYEPDEPTIRLHHGLVAIHPFPDGNGRHGKVAADYLALSLGRRRFTWGAGLDIDTPSLRLKYQAALQEADHGDIARLLVFSRS